MTNRGHTDFEGTPLGLGDEVITTDLDKHGNAIRRGIIVRMCENSVKVDLTLTCRHSGAVSNRVIQRWGGAVALVKKAEVTQDA